MCLEFLTTPFMNIDDTVHRLLFFSFNFFSVIVYESILILVIDKCYTQLMQKKNNKRSLYGKYTIQMIRAKCVECEPNVKSHNFIFQIKI